MSKARRNQVRNQVVQQDAGKACDNLAASNLWAEPVAQLLLNPDGGWCLHTAACLLRLCAVPGLLRRNKHPNMEGNPGQKWCLRRREGGVR